MGPARQRNIGEGREAFAPEAFDYEDDVTAEAVERLRDRASAWLKSDEWDVIEGYAPTA